MSATSPLGSEHGHDEGNEGIEPQILGAIRQELAEERARKASLEARGLGLSAAGGASLALVYGLGSRYTGDMQSAFFVILFLAGVFLLATSVFGWLANRTLDYPELDPVEFSRLLDKGWEGSTNEFMRYLARGHLQSLTTARNLNDDKARWYGRALRSLIGGAICVLAETFIVLMDRLT